MARNQTSQRLGAEVLEGGGARFLVWAPKAGQVLLEIVRPQHHTLEMQPLAGGYFQCELADLKPGACYYYRLDGGPLRPDPASLSQPEGVHGPSQVVDLRFPWSDQGWTGLPLSEYILYELHIGAFTPAGTFDAAIERLDELVELGVTAIEPLPIAQFPGSRNWGYDGVHPFAAQNSYGGPDGFFRFVDACHARSLAVVLDVVYNHLGPEGNYLGEFGHYFTPRYHTPWGDAINFDSRASDEVRRYFLENAALWIRDFHVDALRLDAVHAIFDNSARPFLRELAETVRAAGQSCGRRAYTIAESNQNDPRRVLPASRGGCSLDAQWNDDFHHALHVALTGEHDGYYSDFQSLADLGKSLAQGFIYDGQYSSYRGRRHGASSAEIEPERLVIFSQNHDQVGNRLLGERLASLVDLEAQKLAASMVLLSPYTPMLFMGEEYGETAPFMYFISHLDRELVEQVRRGRKAEFRAFQWEGEIPDPQAEATFDRCKLTPREQWSDGQRMLREFHRELIRLRRTTPALKERSKDSQQVTVRESEKTILVLRRGQRQEVACLYVFGEGRRATQWPLPSGRWRTLLDSADPRWLGEGAAAAEIVVDGDGDGELSLVRPGFSCLMLERLA